MGRWSRYGWCGAGLLLATGSFAQEPESPIPLPEVQVPAPPDEAPASSPRRRDPTGAVSEVQAGTHRGEAKDTAELLALTPSVVVQDRGGVGQTKTLSVRGAAPNGVLVLLDGMPLSHSGTNVDLSRLPAAILERLEVLRGGAGARYGSGGLGGAVNLVTRSIGDHPRLFAEVGGGSFTSALGSVGSTFPLAGGLGLALVHGAHSQGDFAYAFDDQPTVEDNPLSLRTRENNHSTSGGALFKYRRHLGPGWTLDAMGEGTLDARGLAGTVQNPTPEATQQARRVSGSARLSRPLPQGEVEAMAWGRREALYLSGGMFGPGAWQTDLGVGAELSASWLWAERHGLSATLQTAYETLLQGGTTPSWLRWGAMVSDEWWLGDAFSLIPSLRLDQSGPHTGLSPKLGVSWQLPWQLALTANAGQAHRAPSFLELYVQQGHLLPNENLKPERALYADLALTRRLARAALTVGGYYALYEDLISYEYYPPMLARPYNFAAAQVYGLELEGQWQPRDGVTASGSYSLLFSANLRDDPRYYLKELPYRPRHKLHLRVAAGPRWLSGRVELLYQSEQFQNRTQTLALPARAMVNVGLSSTLGPTSNLSLSLELKNLLDAHAADLDGYPLPPRAAYLTVAWSHDWTPPPEGER